LTHRPVKLPQKHTKTHKNTQKHTKTHKNTQKHMKNTAMRHKIHQNTQILAPKPANVPKSPNNCQKALPAHPKPLFSREQISSPKSGLIFGANFGFLAFSNSF